jgi:hypothetical protein
MGVASEMRCAPKGSAARPCPMVTVGGTGSGHTRGAFDLGLLGMPSLRDARDGLSALIMVTWGPEWLPNLVVLV